MHVDGNEYATTAPAAVPVLAMVARVDELYRTLLAAKDAELVSKEAVLAGKDAEIVAKDQLAAELRRRAEQAEAGRDAPREHLTGPQGASDPGGLEALRERIRQLETERAQSKAPGPAEQHHALWEHLARAAPQAAGQRPPVPPPRPGLLARLFGRRE